MAFTLGCSIWNTVVVLLMRVGGLYLSGASGRQRYRVIMQGDVVWRTRFGLWMEIPFAISRCTILVAALFVRHLAGRVILGSDRDFGTSHGGASGVHPVGDSSI